MLQEVLDEIVTDGMLREGQSGMREALVSRIYSDRAKTIREGPGTLVTNSPSSVVLGEKVSDRGGDRRVDQSWSEEWRPFSFENLPEGAFVALCMRRISSGCKYAGGDYVIPLVGEVPHLDFGTAFARWAEEVEEEAWEFLRKLPRSRKASQTLRFAAGVSARFAPHDQRRKAWVSALLQLGLTGDINKIIRSVRTATPKAALRLGWTPATPPPQYWEGLPEGVVRITL